MVTGIDIKTRLWTDGEKMIPVDYRMYDPAHDGKTKNDHARDMLDTAEKRGFKPRYVLFDIWYSSSENLKAVDKKGWHWVAELKANRQVSVVQGTYLSVKALDWASTQVHKVWLKAYKFIQVAEVDLEKGDIPYIATSDLALTEPEPIKTHYECRWQIEAFHLGIKQCCGIEHCYSQVERSQRIHILCAFLAFLTLQIRRIKEGISWYEQKRRISRMAISAYLANA